MKYFKNVKSYEDLKNQFKTLLKANHPDNGGDAETMKEINVEYDSIFKIWKDKKETETGEKVTETANSTRSDFYTANGWAGCNYNMDRTLKEIAVIVRNYVKEKYPTFKFSVRTSYASMCQELHVDLKQAPFDIYKSIDELDEEEINKLMGRAICNRYTNLRSWTQDEAKQELQRMWNDGISFVKVYRDDVATMLADVDDFVRSYNREDCDGMIDYFDVNFYYFDCKPYDLKIVPKTARIKNTESKPAPKKDVKYSEGTCNKSIPCCGCSERDTCTKEKVNVTVTPIEEKTEQPRYKITQGEDTRDGSRLWLVRIQETLSKEDYVKENNKMRELGGYYSKFKHSFIFRIDPTNLLTA